MVSSKSRNLQKIIFILRNNLSKLKFIYEFLIKSFKELIKVSIGQTESSIVYKISKISKTNVESYFRVRTTIHCWLRAVKEVSHFCEFFSSQKLIIFLLVIFILLLLTFNEIIIKILKFDESNLKIILIQIDLPILDQVWSKYLQTLLVIQIQRSFAP